MANTMYIIAVVIVLIFFAAAGYGGYRYYEDNGKSFHKFYAAGVCAKGDHGCPPTSDSCATYNTILTGGAEPCDVDDYRKRLPGQEDNYPNAPKLDDTDFAYQ